MKPSTDMGVIRYDEAAAEIAGYAARMSSNRARLAEPERVDLSRASGRVLAQPIRADRDLPPFTRSTRDGFACRAADACHHEPLKLAGATRAGEAPGGPLPKGAAWEIMTGAPVPAGADAVVMLEHVKSVDGMVRMLPPRTVVTGENIVPQGAEAHDGDELLPAGTLMGAAQIGLAASCGYAVVEVYPRPRVAILATGDELVPVASDPRPGQIRNSNGPMLAALVAAAGGQPWIFPTAADDEEALDALIRKARGADMLLITGGVSAGKFDLVEPALERAGARFHFTGVQMQPGKPVVFGDFPSSNSADQEFSFFGLPGNPVSSAVTFLLFAAPVFAALAGGREFGPRFALAQLAKEVRHKPGLTRFLLASCSFGGQPPEVTLVPWQGSGDVAALARSNCFLVMPEDVQQMNAGQTVRILLL